jgi:esterase/lipase
MLPGNRDARRAYRARNSVRLSPNVLRLWRPYTQLRALAREASDNLKNVRVPVSSVFSRRDETVAFISAQILSDGLTSAPSKQTVTLERAMHAWAAGDERERIHAAFRDFLSEHITQRGRR